MQKAVVKIKITKTVESIRRVVLYFLTRAYPDNQNDNFQYDAASRLAQAVSNRYQNTVNRAYHSDGTLASEELISHGQSFNQSYFYDTAKRNYLSYYPNGETLTKTFTDRNQLASIGYDGQSVASFAYDAGLREITRTYGNNLTQNINYNLDNTISQKSTSDITNFSYTYNKNKNKLSETDQMNSALSQSFNYDDEQRLTSWSSNGNILNQSQSWNLSPEAAWLSNTKNGMTENDSWDRVRQDKLALSSKVKVLVGQGLTNHPY